ncbi:MAG: VCBS repeat-containing protein [Bryobacteraceae bacterium]
MARKLIVSLWLAALVAPAQNLTFHTVAEATVGVPFAGPISVSSGDFNNDGVVDLAVGDYDGAAVEIVLGSAGGAFQQHRKTVVGSSVRQIAVADLDRDGNLDVIAVCTDPNITVVLKGKGDGTFADAVRLGFGARGLAVLASDLNGDGIPDLAVGQDRSVLVAFGNGDATFAPATAYAVNGEPVAIRAADLNGDGIPDLVIAAVDSTNYGTGSVSILLGTAAATFRSITAVPVGRPADLAIGDFNNDKVPDVAIASGYNSEYYVALGNGDGSLGIPAKFEMKEGPLSVASADFNGDGIADLVFGNYYGGSVAILLSKGDGTFQRMPDILLKGDTYAIAATDMNGDGVVDVIAANHSSRSAAVAYGGGEGLFHPALTIGSGPSMAATGAFDPDGKPALAVLNAIANSVVVYRAGLQTVDAYAVGDTPLQVVTGDFNGDGMADIATLNSGSEDVSVLFVKADGSLEPARQIPVGKNPVSLTAADFNHDGLTDLLITFAAEDGLLLLSTPCGGFELPKRISGITGNRPVAAADFNLDGIPDLAATSQSSGAALQILLGRGDGTFQKSATYQMDGFPGALLTPDVNGDGKPDLVINLGIAIAVLLGKGDGTFENAFRSDGLAGGTGTFTTMAAADFDGDGKLDVVAGTGRALLLLAGNGDGTLRSPVAIGIDGPVVSLSLLDWNQDGRSDLIGLNPKSGTVSVYVDAAIE